MNTDVSSQFPAAPGYNEWVLYEIWRRFLGFCSGFRGLRADSVEAGLDGVVEAIIEAVWLDGL